MSSEEQRQPGQPHDPDPQQGWQPLPQGEYDIEATAFVQLPEGLLDMVAMPPGSDPLAAPGHGYVPPPITPGTAGGDSGAPAHPAPPADPGAGQWTMPFGDGAAPHHPAPETHWPAPGEERPSYGAAHDTGWTGPNAEGPAGPWTVPPAADDIPDESGEYLLRDSGGAGGTGQWQVHGAASGTRWDAERDGTAPAPDAPWHYAPQEQHGSPHPGAASPGQHPAPPEQHPGAPDGSAGHWNTAGRDTGHWTVPRDADPADRDAPGAYRPDGVTADGPAPGPHAPGSPDDGGRPYDDHGSAYWEARGTAPAVPGTGAPAGPRPPEPRAGDAWPAAPQVELPGPRDGFGTDVPSSGSYGGGLPAGAPWPDAGGGHRPAPEHPEHADAAPRSDAPAPGHDPAGHAPAAGHAPVAGHDPEPTHAPDSPQAADAHPADAHAADTHAPDTHAPDSTHEAAAAGEPAARPTDAGTAAGTPAAGDHDAEGAAPGHGSANPAAGPAPAGPGDTVPDGTRLPGAAPVSDAGPVSDATPVDGAPVPGGATAPGGAPAPGGDSVAAADGPAGAGEPGDPAHPAAPDAAGPDAAPQDEPAAYDPHSEHPYASYLLTVNGTDRPVTEAWIGESLLYVLRERLGLAGAKDGCSQGECGACSVQVDGRLVASCLVPAATAAGCEIRTVEGLATDGAASDVQRALAAKGAVQCGFCVPGLAMTVHDLLEGNHAPTELETRQAICGNLCRCSGYRGVLDAVREVVENRIEAAEAAGPADEAPDGTPPGPQADTTRIPHQTGPYGGATDPSTGGPA
ncbi:2Fe-2S iron-sulfur cluster-binding protein [Streptomyces sp. NPDC001922]|uniref:2Fe-2S iron-sulfur cluster-binding protein n=1 Tax=Streptomyces sp. NPDC001922 TaxID=3364624 RepID=UPI00367F7BC4